MLCVVCAAGWCGRAAPWPHHRCPQGLPRCHTSTLARGVLSCLDASQATLQRSGFRCGHTKHDMPIIPWPPMSLAMPDSTLEPPCCEPCARWRTTCRYLHHHRCVRIPLAHPGTESKSSCYSHARQPSTCCITMGLLPSTTLCAHALCSGRWTGVGPGALQQQSMAFCTCVAWRLSRHCHSSLLAGRR
jgi:hypothetical protein